MTPGTKLSTYEIVAFIGAGGKGEVYHAKDTKLKRDVALKVLPEAFASDPERMARFQREALVSASLSHPNIAAIYGVEERVLILELVDGPTLAERFAQRPIPLDEVVFIARQIAEALEYAHERGVIHRDLKPANIKVTPEGRVKVLDFGLAKAMSGEATTASPASSPTTLTMHATQIGVLLGTAAYMSPEQARGQTVDRRADIWAFGVVLYEMIAGRALFAGPTISDTLAAILKTEPDAAAVPPELRPIVERCLRRDPRRRWRDIGDVRLALEEGLPIAAAPVPRRSWLPWAVTAMLAIGLFSIGVALWRVTRPVLHPLLRLSADLPLTIDPNAGANVIVSPDGTRLVFGTSGTDGKQRLSTGLLSQSQSSPIPGNEGARADAFFSPDGDWVGFFRNSKLWKIPIQGCAAVEICNARNPRGASWGDDNRIVFAPDLRGGLVRVSANAGIPEPLTQLKAGEVSHRWPQLLPRVRGVLFTAGNGASWEDASIELQSLKSGQRKMLHKGGSYGRYVPSGHLIYVHQSTLFARPFHLEHEEVTGLPAAVLDDVTNTYCAVTGSAQFAISEAPSGHGTLVYRTGQEAQRSIYWLDDTGNAQSLTTAGGIYFCPRFSPDGTRLVVALFSGNTGLWVLDWQRDNFFRITNTAGDSNPVWSPDGKHIAYNSAQTGIFWARSDGSSPPQRLTRSEHIVRPYSFSPDGKRIAYYEATPETGSDVWMLSLEGSESDHPTAGTPEAFLRTEANEKDPAFSPDGRWVAYTSDESGVFEVYVRPFPGPGHKWPISTVGGMLTMWSSSGHELAYRTLDGRLIVVSCDGSRETFTVGKRRVWSNRQLSSSEQQDIDFAPDGKRFAVLMRLDTSADRTSGGGVSFLLNFFDELRRRVPGGK